MLLENLGLHFHVVDVVNGVLFGNSSRVNGIVEFKIGTDNEIGLHDRAYNHEMNKSRSRLSTPPNLVHNAMAEDQLTPYLLDSSLIDYTIAATSEALQLSDPALQEQSKKKATYALQFFLNILDPSFKKEKEQLDTFRLYYAALNGRSQTFIASNMIVMIHPGLAAKLVQDLPMTTESTVKKYQPKTSDLTPAQFVLSLPDTLDTIFAHIPLLTQSDRDTFYRAALTSHAFHNVAQLRLWRHPRDLDTVEQQVRFAFGAAISSAVGESLGLLVKRLRIRIVKGVWNMRLVETNVTLTPGVVNLTLHWGDTLDAEVPVTPSLVASLHTVLTSLPDLKHLKLVKYAYTPNAETKLQIPADAHSVFTKLESLQLYDFHWYWQPISHGLGPALRVLDIGYGTMISGDKIVELSAKLTSLISLRISSGVEVRHIRGIVGNLPKLEHVEIINFTEVDDEYVVAAIPLLASLESLKELSFNRAIGSTQLKVLVDSPGPLEEVSLKLKLDGEAADTLERLLKAKRETLEAIIIKFSENDLAPSDTLVEVLANVPRLERILIDFETGHKLSSSFVDKLLVQCPKLKWTSSLECLVAGNSLYETEYRARLERERDEELEAMEEDILGN
ncbi:hypothetical protein C0993_009790 [Termitomyces sp. T159_Od127]|nr:hypothetical protein C0993_009790 [Termitomyces sp. T159_Od127]